MKRDKNKRHSEKSGSLAAQIKETEQRLKDRQRNVNVRADILVKDLRQQITSPATLLLAGGAGFIVGELTTHPPKNERRSIQPDTVVKSEAHMTPLRNAIDFMSLAHNLYQLLPLVFIMDIFYPENASKTESPSHVKQNQSV
ncbi:MAG: hypothetical protein ACXWT3_02630 [Methylococcaceae bacterium]